MQVLDEVMETRGRPDSALYATIIEGLWQSGGAPQRLRALRRFNAALAGNVHGLAASVTGSETTVEVRPPIHPSTPSHCACTAVQSLTSCHSLELLDEGLTLLPQPVVCSSSSQAKSCHEPMRSEGRLCSRVCRLWGQGLC